MFNSGNLLANSTLTLNSTGDIINEGSVVSGGTLTATPGRDIITGDGFDAASAMLDAARDINLRTDDYDIEGSILFSAGRDISMDSIAETLSFGNTIQDGGSFNVSGNLSFDAGRDLTFTNADIHADGGEPNRVDRVKALLPIKRGGQPMEVAQAILWLLSSEASYTTGTFIEVAGGR